MEHATEPVPAPNAAATLSPSSQAMAAAPLALVRQLGAARLAVLGALGLFAYLLIRVAEPGYVLLYAGLELEDGAEIVRRLEAQNIPYRLRDDGATILVPADSALRMR